MEDEAEEAAAPEEAEEVVAGTNVQLGQLKQVKEKKKFTDEEAESTVAEFMEK